MSTVAVALCNYNHAKYLRDCLGNIVSQTRPPEQIVIVDDGSTDDSWDIIQEFARRYPNLQPLCNGRNLGVMTSLQRAMAAVKSDYVVVTAADDVLMPDFLARNMAALERHPEAGLGFSELVSLIGDTKKVDRFAVNPAVCDIFNLDGLPEFLTPREMRKRMKQVYLPIPPNTAVIRYDLLMKFGGFSPELSWCTDTFTCTALAIRHGACVVAGPLALIRSSPHTASQTAMRDPRYLTVLEAVANRLARPELRDIRRFIRSCPSNLSVFGDAFLKILAKKPRDWDLFVAYTLWTKVAWPLLRYKAKRNLTWAELGLYAVRKFPRRLIKIARSVVYRVSK